MKKTVNHKINRNFIYISDLKRIKSSILFFHKYRVFVDRTRNQLLLFVKHKALKYRSFINNYFNNISFTSSNYLRGCKHYFFFDKRLKILHESHNYTVIALIVLLQQFYGKLAAINQTKQTSLINYSIIELGFERSKLI